MDGTDEFKNPPLSAEPVLDLSRAGFFISGKKTLLC
jgi:hypothetical protein